MKARELVKLGIARGPGMKLAQSLISHASAAGLNRKEIREAIRSVVAAPEKHLTHPYFGELARRLNGGGQSRKDAPPWQDRSSPAPWRQWGTDIEPEAVKQMDNCSRLPVAVSGALMPDAHLGYGLPIGGVLATDGVVIPYAVGVDIACRMRMTVLDAPARELRGSVKRLIRVLEEETSFGLGAEFKSPKDHPIMEEDWGFTPLTSQLRSKARRQLGTSGSGNHFVEFGELTLEEPELGLEAGTYLALLSHSGSRGPGHAVATHYSRLAQDLHPELPRQLRHLAWLDLDSGPGAEYWEAMQLMGRFAAANHELIHTGILRALRAKARATVENHHNFAWKERHGGREVVVHRKGATPADEELLGIIPGSMATPGFVVRGLGSAESLNSAAHGAGRLMSRGRARSTLTWSAVRKLLKESGVTVVSADLDEAPMVYKDIHSVMAAQRDLVRPVARFDPAIVKMAPPGERAED